MTTRRLGSLFVTLLLWSGCADASDTLDLTVHHAVGVDYGDMVANEPVSVVVDLPDLREEAEYDKHRSALVCCHPASDASAFSLVVVDADMMASTIDLLVELRPDEAESFTRLFQYAGSIESGESLSLLSDGVVMDPAGRSLLSGLCLATQPDYELRITLTSAQNHIGLELGLELVLQMSDTASHCPGP